MYVQRYEDQDTIHNRRMFNNFTNRLVSNNCTAESEQFGVGVAYASAVCHSTNQYRMDHISLLRLSTKRQNDSTRITNPAKLKRTIRNIAGIANLLQSIPHCCAFLTEALPSEHLGRTLATHGFTLKQHVTDMRVVFPVVCSTL